LAGICHIGAADLHRAMVATVPAEKLLTGRCAVRNWTRRTILRSFLCRKLQLFLGKSTETAATRAALVDSSIQQIVCRLAVFMGRCCKVGEERRDGSEFVV